MSARRNSKRRFAKLGRQFRLRLPLASRARLAACLLSVSAAYLFESRRSSYDMVEEGKKEEE